MAELTWEVADRVATKVAAYWTRRISGYGFDDLYQDAIEHMHIAARKGDAEREDFEGFLYISCRRETWRKLTLARAPAGARAHGETRQVGETVRKADVTVLEFAPAAIDYDRHVYLNQLQERMQELAQEVEGGQRALQVALGLADVRDFADDPEERQAIYTQVRKLKGKLRKDMTLYRMARE